LFVSEYKDRKDILLEAATTFRAVSAGYSSKDISRTS
jgi:hypothetical protein